MNSSRTRGRLRDRPGDQYANLSEQLPESARSQASRKEPGEEDGYAAGQSGQQPDREQGVAEQPTIDTQQQNRKRRMIHVTPVKPVAAGDAVELIAEKAEPSVRHQVKGHFDQCGNQQHGQSSRDHGKPSVFDSLGKPFPFIISPASPRPLSSATNGNMRNSFNLGQERLGQAAELPNSGRVSNAFRFGPGPAAKGQCPERCPEG